MHFISIVRNRILASFTLITWAVFEQDEEKALLFAAAFPYMIAKIFYKLGKKVFKKA